MRRCDLQLVALARQGDGRARIEVAKRYLRGGEGFPKNIQTGLDYLAHPTVQDRIEALAIVCESLSIEELLQYGLEAVLKRAAELGYAPAQFKLGVWLLTHEAQLTPARAWLSAAASAGDECAAMAVSVVSAPGSCMSSVFRLLGSSGLINGAAIALIGARQAIQAADLERLCRCLACAASLPNACSDSMAELTVSALQLAAETSGSVKPLGVETIQSALEAKTEAGDVKATYFLGCALAGINVCASDVPLVRSTNLRAGVATLLRAADGGEAKAWIELYRLVADHESPVANSQLSHFFLEKAAKAGDTVAQRIFGGVLLSKASSLKESERAIEWLFMAAQSGDSLAKQLLGTLVLPFAGRLTEAQAAADVIRSFDPLLATRLMMARHFGLTKLEALTVNPHTGFRSWGLVVERNPFIVQGRLSAPRAIPAVTTDALETANIAANLFSQSRQDDLGMNGNLRQRTARLRIACERFDLDESLFFSSASASQLDRHRFGPKWAYRVRETLQHALTSDGVHVARRMHTAF